MHTIGKGALILCGPPASRIEFRVVGVARASRMLPSCPTAASRFAGHGIGQPRAYRSKNRVSHIRARRSPGYLCESFESSFYVGDRSFVCSSPIHVCNDKLPSGCETTSLGLGRHSALPLEKAAKINEQSAALEGTKDTEMNRAEVLTRSAKVFPSIFREITTLSIRGYLPPIHKHWWFRAHA